MGTRILKKTWNWITNIPKNDLKTGFSKRLQLNWKGKQKEVTTWKNGGEAKSDGVGGGLPALNWRRGLLLAPAGDTFWRSGRFFRCQFSHRILMIFGRLLCTQSSKSWSNNYPKWLQKSIPKRSENEHGELSEDHKNIIRMQGAKTLKIMLPCWRRVHLHKSASFKQASNKSKQVMRWC